MKVAIAVIVSAAGLVTIYSGMIGTYNVARWIQHVANYNFYIDPRWDWVAETLLYAAAFLTCGGVSMATGMPQVARQVMAGHEAEASSVASCI